MLIVAQIVNIIFQVLTLLILARVIFSWIRVDPYHPTWGPILRFVHNATEPIMAPVRQLIPPMAGLDFSPIIVFFGLDILRRLIIGLLI